MNHKREKLEQLNCLVNGLGSAKSGSAGVKETKSSNQRTLGACKFFSLNWIYVKIFTF